MKQLGVRVKGEESERGGSNLKVTQSDNAGTQVRVQILFLTSIWAIDIFCPLVKAYSCMNFDVDI